MGEQTATETATQRRNGSTVDMKLEVEVIPVADVDRAKRFYQSLGWRLDGDFSKGADWRGVQLTPLGSSCSIIFGKGVTTAVPGSAQGMFLVVDDIEAARADLIARGVSVSPVFHFDDNEIHVAGTDGRTSGPDPHHLAYSSWASFSDPDGNEWLLQEVKTRLPGRGFSLDLPSLTALLRETEERHGMYEPTAPKHHWSRWYAAYLVARHNGKSPDEAARDAAVHIESNQP